MMTLMIKRISNLALVGILALSLVTISCNKILDVSNPNSLTEDDISEPSSAKSLKNGLLNSLMVSTGWVYAATTTISDEIYSTGSYESYKTFNEGRIAFESNEITVAGFPNISQARYMADLAILTISEFDANNELADRSLLASVYIYSAVVRITIADSYDNFVYSNKQETSPAIGESNMSQVYDEAIDHATKALDIALALEDKELEAQAFGIRARAKHAKAVWAKLNPSGTTPVDPIVTGSGASADADSALVRMSEDYKAKFDYQSITLSNYLANQVNSRGEITVIPDTVGAVYEGVPYDRIEDPKTGDLDPRFEQIRDDFLDTEKYKEDYSPITWLSWREMHLIIAEEFIGVNDVEARNHINTVRSLDALPDVIATDDLIEFIEHERRANLFLQGRRLNDMYRFGSVSPAWLSGEDALTTPGTLLPIPSNELLANPDL